MSPPLCTGMTADVNQSAGSRPLFTDALRSWVKGFTGICADGITISGRMPSGPAAYSPPICFSLFRTSFSVISSLDISTVRVL